MHWAITVAVSVVAGGSAGYLYGAKVEAKLVADLAAFKADIAKYLPETVGEAKA